MPASNIGHDTSYVGSTDVSEKISLHFQGRPISQAKGSTDHSECDGGSFHARESGKNVHPKRRIHVSDYTALCTGTRILIHYEIRLGSASPPGI